MGATSETDLSVIKVGNVENCSPAAAITGQLKKGQITENINVHELADIDPHP